MLPRGGSSQCPGRQARQIQLARVSFPLEVFRRRVTGEVRRWKYPSGVVEGLCHVHRRRMTNLLNLARDRGDFWQPGVVVMTVTQLPV